MAFEEEDNITNNTQLVALSDSDYQIVDGEPDITGWNVLTSDGVKLGEVDDLLFDPQSRSVRYLVVELQADGKDIVDDRTVLVPIGVAELHTDDDDVIVPNVTALQLTGLPVYEGGPIDPQTEWSIRNVFEGGSTAPYDAPQFYEHEHFDEDRFYSPRTVVTESIITEESPEEEAERKEKVQRIIARIERKDNPEQL